MEVKIIVPKFPNGIAIGEERENLAVPVVVDYTAWIEQHGTGALQILLQRPQDADPYPVTVTNDNGEAVWAPNETDMNFKGRGEIQLVYTAGGVIERSPVIMVISGRSLVAAGDPPDPFETWLEELTELAAETLVNAQSAEDSASEANADALRAAQSALDAEAAKTGAETAEQTAQQAAALARAKAAEAAEAAQIAGREADYAQQQRIMAEADAVDAHDSAESAAQSAEDAQAAASAAQTAASAAAASASAAAGSAADAAAAVTEVETKGAEQITAINQAGTTQIAAVDAAGAVQVQAIEDKGEEVIASIPSDYTELADDVSDLKSSVDQLSQLPDADTGKSYRVEETVSGGHLVLSFEEVTA